MKRVRINIATEACSCRHPDSEEEVAVIVT